MGQMAISNGWHHCLSFFTAFQANKELENCVTKSQKCKMVLKVGVLHRDRDDDSLAMNRHTTHQACQQKQS